MAVGGGILAIGGNGETTNENATIEMRVMPRPLGEGDASLEWAGASSLWTVREEHQATEEPVSEPASDVPPAVVDAPAPAAPVEAVHGARHDLAALVGAAFPDDPRMATHVVWAESIGDWNPRWECTVYGACWSSTMDCGLMQIHWAAHYDKFWRRGWTEADCWIPERNLEIAREVYDVSGGTAWTTY